MNNSIIQSISTRDARFPIGCGHGSDAIHKDPVYSYAVTLLHDERGRTGTGRCIVQVTQKVWQ